MKNLEIALCGAIFLLPAVVRAQSNGRLVEEIVARVNNSIVTLADYEKAQATLREEVTHDCQGCPPARIEAQYKEHEKNLLRDLIDQELLVERAKDLGINVETDVVRRLDQVRQQNNLATIDDLEKAVESQGIAWEDYKSQIRNGLLTQDVIRREVGSRINISSDEVKKYYEEHKQEFVRPEQVYLAEIFLSTEGKSPEEIAAVQKKAEDLRNRIKKGEDFSELAKRYSEGTTAKEGGGLGAFEHGQLSKQLEDVVFKMNKREVTDVVQTKTGFEILEVMDHFQAGLQPLDKVENEILNKIYSQRMQPALRDYLAELREESYVTVKPGYTDSAAAAGAAIIQETAPTPDTPGQNKKRKLPKPKSSGG